MCYLLFTVASSAQPRPAGDDDDHGEDSDERAFEHQYKPSSKKRAKLQSPSRADDV
jgi:hypothetical protein